VKHLTKDQLSALIDGRLEPDKLRDAEKHLDECSVCRDEFAELGMQDHSLNDSLSHDPGDAYFENFAERVQDRARSGHSMKLGAGGPLGALASWFTTPQNVALAGALGAVIVGVGAALLVANQNVEESLRDAEMSARIEQKAHQVKLTRAEKAEEAQPSATDATGKKTAPGKDAKSGKDEAEPGPSSTGLSDLAMRQSAEFHESNAPAPAAEPARAYEVRRNAQGEDERVNPSSGFARPAPAASASGSVADVKKALVAQPLAGARADEEADRDIAPARRGPADTEMRLCGDVRDPSGRPLRFASVTLITRNVGVQSDEHGRFCLRGAAGWDSVVVQLLGYRPVRRAVALSSDTPDLTITLHPVPALGTMAVRSKSATNAPAWPPPLAQSGLDSDEIQLPDSALVVAEYARRLSTVATRSKDARQYEAAAVQWQRLLPYVMGGPLEIETRGKVAEYRFHAWEVDPDSRRQQAAREALTAYLVRAPAGPERNRATLWLDMVAK
jgi:hypothetical protein